MMPGLRSAARRGALGAAAAIAITGVLAACGGPPPPDGPAISLLSAQVTEPNANGVTDAYVIVQNKGPADELVGARTSVGGTVALRLPTGHGTIMMRTVSTITIPARSLFRLDPNGAHLLITRSGRMKSGTEITLTLIFAHAGAISVPAMVTNPQTGGSSYFLN
jgi:copper(I)-binding protein